MDRRRLIRIAIFLFLIVAIPLTVFIAQRQQEIRQRAQVGPANLFFSQGTTCSQPISTLVLNQSQTISLCLNSNSIEISGYDITMALNNLQQLAIVDQLQEGSDASLFTSSIFFPTIQNASIRFSRVTTNISQIPQGTLNLLNISFTPSSQGQTSIEVTNALIVSPSTTDPVGVNLPTLTLNISSSITTTPPTNTPTPTGILPTPTLVPGGTYVATTVSLRGIAQPPSTCTDPTKCVDNPNPRNRTRQATLCLYAPGTDPVGDTNATTVCGNSTAKVLDTLQFDDATKKFKGLLLLPSSFVTGSYDVLLVIDGYLRKRIPGVHQILSGQQNVVPEVKTVGTDLNKDNILDILDYHIFLSCYQNKFTCTSDNRKKSDFNDDGTIDNKDLQIILVSFQTREGD